MADITHIIDPAHPEYTPPNAPNFLHLSMVTADVHVLDLRQVNQITWKTLFIANYVGAEFFWFRTGDVSTIAAPTAHGDGCGFVAPLTVLPFVGPFPKFIKLWTPGAGAAGTMRAQIELSRVPVTL